MMDLILMRDPVFSSAGYTKADIRSAVNSVLFAFFLFFFRCPSRNPISTALSKPYT